MEKTVPARLSAEPSEQLTLPLEESTPANTETKDVRPRRVWRTLGPKSRTSVKERWVRVMREVASDARD
jgi:hypothetical protein